MKKIIFSALCALPLIVSLTSCGKKKDEPNQPSTPEAVTKTVTIDASKYETWQYFSFSKGEVLNVTDYKNDLNWDMALHRYDVRLNCGESGKGKGGAVFSGKTEMDQATTVPTDGYTVDVLGRITVKYEMGPDGHQMEYEEQGFSEVITGKKNAQGFASGGWLEFSHGPAGPTYKLSKRVFFVRGADGNIAKVQFTDYQDAELKKGVITFTYTYPVK